MTKSTKIAVQISGKFSDNPECIQSIIRNVIKPYNADVFLVYTEDEQTISKDDLIRLLNPKGIYYNTFPAIIQSNVRYLNLYSKEPETNIDSFTKMCWGILEANNLRKNSGESYDVIIRCRPDTIIHNKLELNITNDLWIPIGWDHRGGYNDTFAYGNSEIMDWYSELYNKILIYGNSYFKIHPESFLKIHLDSKPFGIMRWHFPISLRGIKLNELEFRQK